MDLQQLTQSLRDPAVFNQHVKTNNGLRTGAFTALGVGAAFLAYNLFSTWRAISESGFPMSGSLFWRVFWDPSGADAKSSAYLFVTVYGAPILLAVGLVLLVLSMMNKGSHAAGQHQRYLAGGYVARQERLGLKYSESQQRGAKIDLAVLTHPGQSEQDFANMTGYLRQRVEDKAEGKRVAKLMARAHGRPTPVNELMPDLPAYNLVARALPRDPVVVMPPAPGKANPEVLMTRN